MIVGQIVTYAPQGPLGHILGGCPGVVRDTGLGFAVVAFGAILEPCQLTDLQPARLWWRRGRGAWHGPFPDWAEARGSLVAAGVKAEGLAHGATCPHGAETISGGWRHVLAWGGDDPPTRHG